MDKTNIKLLIHSKEPFAVLTKSLKNGKYTCYSFDDNMHFDATLDYIYKSKEITDDTDIKKYIKRLGNLGYTNINLIKTRHYKVSEDTMGLAWCLARGTTDSDNPCIKEAAIHLKKESSKDKFDPKKVLKAPLHYEFNC